MRGDIDSDKLKQSPHTDFSINNIKQNKHIENLLINIGNYKIYKYTINFFIDELETLGTIMYPENKDWKEVLDDDVEELKKSLFFDLNVVPLEEPILEGCKKDAND